MAKRRKKKKAKPELTFDEYLKILPALVIFTRSDTANLRLDLGAEVFDNIDMVLQASNLTHEEAIDVLAALLFKVVRSAFRGGHLKIIVNTDIQPLQQSKHGPN